jgi:hypothetical protein
MKKLNKTITIGNMLLLLLFVSFSGWSQSQTHALGSPGVQKHTATLLSDKSNSISIKFNLNEFTLNEIETNYGKAFTVITPKAPNLQEKGCPDLLYLTGSVVISEKGNTGIEVIPGEFKEYFNIELAPSKGILSRDIDPSTIPFEKGKVYKNDEFFPGQLAQLRDPYILRDFRGQTVEVYPVQYNPVTKTLRVYTEIVVNIYQKEGIGVNELADARTNKKVYGEFDNIYRRNFLNYSKRAKYTPVGEEGRLLIVSHSNYMEAMKPFVNWKNQKGQPTTLINYTTAGGSAAALTTYIANQYNSEDGLMFVLLVGDGNQVHTIEKTLSGTSPSPAYCDPAYGFIAGSDAYAEVFVGRFSAESVADVETQVARAITYERDLTSSDTWLKNGMGLASSEGGGSQGDNGESDIQHMNIIRGKLLGFNYTAVDQVYDPGATATTVVNNLNAGRGIANYVGHGSDTYWVTSGFGLNNMTSLTNVNKLPFVFDVACVNGRFVGQNCFAEGFVRARKTEGPTGAIAIIAGSINQSWNSPMRGQDEMNDILVESYSGNIKRTFGGISVNGCMNMNDAYSTDGFNMTNTWVIFGDPSLVVRTNTPAEMVVSHNPTMFLGASTFNVSADAEGAVVAISYLDAENNVVLVGKGIVESGVATVTFPEPISSPLDLTITVTAYNKVTYIETISAVPADEPYVVLKSFSTTATPNYGELVGLDITLENVSEIPYTASNVTATITTENQFVTILNGFAEVASIDPAQIVDINGVFQIAISNNVPDQTPMVFTITITGIYDSETYEWTQNFTIKANAPVLSIGALTVVDSQSGNGDGLLDAGETAQLVFTVANTGHAAVSGVQGQLALAGGTSPYLTIKQGSSSLEGLAAGGSGSLTFLVKAQGDTPAGTAVDLAVTATGGAYAATAAQAVTIGVIPVYLMSNAPVTACSGTFYDSGGPTGSYALNENFTKTFTAATPGAMLRFAFGAFDTESGYDKLFIYDGPTTSATLLGTYMGTTSPGTITSSGSALTFKFTSDASVVKSGWQATLSCVTPTEAPACASAPAPANGAANVTSGTLTWASAGATEHDVYVGTAPNPAKVATVTSPSYTLGLEPGTTYYWRVVSRNIVGESTGCAEWSFTAGSAAGGAILMASGTVTTCSGTFYDTGGATGAYGSSENLTMTFLPATPGAKLKFQFTAFATENSYDSLMVWDRANATSGGYLGKFMGETGVPAALQNLTATNASGALTFRFKSDGSVTKPGWAATISCEGGAAPVVLHVAVTDGEGPIQGASVSILGIIKTTDATGTATYSLPGETSYPYAVYANGYQGQTGTLALGAEEQTETIALTAVYPVTFSVTNAQSGAPLFNALVGVGGSSRYTNLGGLAILELAAGEYAATITRAGHEAAEVTLTVAGAQEVPVALNGIYTLLVVVTDATTGSALAGATVEIGGTTDLTDPTGEFEAQLAGGTYAYAVGLDGYTTATGSLALTGHTELEVALVPQGGPTTYTVTFAITTTGEVALEGAEIAIAGQTLTTDATGSASIALAPGSYAYGVTHGDCHAHEDTLEVTDHDLPMPLVMTPLGIGSAQLAAVQLFPNPFSSRITITGAAQARVIVISSILGQELLRVFNADNDLLDIPTASLPSGVYLITLVGQANETRVTKMVKN